MKKNKRMKIFLLPLIFVGITFCSCKDSGGSSQQETSDPVTQRPEQNPNPTTTPTPQPTTTESDTQLKQDLIKQVALINETVLNLKEKGVIWGPDGNLQPLVLMEFKLNLIANNQSYDVASTYDLFFKLQKQVDTLIKNFQKILESKDLEFYSKLKDQLELKALDDYWENSRTLYEYCQMPQQPDGVRNLFFVIRENMNDSLANCREIETATNKKYLVLKRINDRIDLRPLRSLMRSSVRHLEIISGMNYSVTEPLDLSPLAGFTNLEELGVQGFFVTNVEALKGLTNLKTLDLADNSIEDIAPLSALPKLDTLILRKNKIHSPQLLFNLVQLKSLDLSENLLTSLEGVEKIRNLEQLSIRANQVEELNPLTEMVQLTYLNVSYNLIQSFKPLSNLSLLKYFSGDNNRLLSDTDHCPLDGKSKLVTDLCQKLNPSNLSNPSITSNPSLSSRGNI